MRRRTLQLAEAVDQLISNGLSIQYDYPSTGNNGKIASQSDGQRREGDYTYDSLNRLATANNSASHAHMGPGFSYDGFGNLTQTSVTQGSAPTMSASYDANNHPGGEDANGNPGYVPVPTLGTSAAGTYDVENRLLTVSGVANYSICDEQARLARDIPASGSDGGPTRSLSGASAGASCRPTRRRIRNDALLHPNRNQLLLRRQAHPNNAERLGLLRPPRLGRQVLSLRHRAPIGDDERHGKVHRLPARFGDGERLCRSKV